MKRILTLFSLSTSLFLLSSLSTQLNAQSWRIQSASISQSTIDSCGSTTVNLTAFLGCINWQVGAVTYTVFGSAVEVEFACTSSPVCAGAVSTPSDTVLVQNLAPGTYSVTAKAILDNRQTNIMSAGTLTVNPCITTNLKETNLTPELNLYPNPTSGEVFLDLELNGNYTYKLVDVKGSLINTGVKVFNSNRNSLRFDNVQPGIYFLTITNNKVQFNKRIVIY